MGVGAWSIQGVGYGGHCSGLYASYWNAVLLFKVCVLLSNCFKSVN